MAAPASSSPIYNLRASGDGKSAKAPALSTVLLSNYVTTTNKTMWGIERKRKEEEEKRNDNCARSAAKKFRPSDLGTKFIISDVWSLGQRDIKRGTHSSVGNLELA